MKLSGKPAIGLHTFYGIADYQKSTFFSNFIFESQKTPIFMSVVAATAMAAIAAARTPKSNGEIINWVHHFTLYAM